MPESTPDERPLGSLRSEAAMFRVVVATGLLALPVIVVGLIAGPVAGALVLVAELVAGVVLVARRLRGRRSESENAVETVPRNREGEPG